MNIELLIERHEEVLAQRDQLVEALRFVESQEKLSMYGQVVVKAALQPLEEE